MPQTDYLLKDGRTLRFTRPQRADAAEMLAFLSVVGRETDFLLNDSTSRFTLEQEEDYLEASAKDAHGGMFVGRVDGKIVCTYGVGTQPRERVRHNVTIGLTVLKEFWGLGAGGAMLDHALACARETGVVKNMWLGVREDNFRAIALYEKFGFREAGRHKNALFVKGVYYDEILMDVEV